TALLPEIAPGRVSVLALDDGHDAQAYPPEVIFQIQAQEQRDYFTAAELLNINQFDALIIQHEFGIFGGADGRHVLGLAQQARMPVSAVLHTVLSEPSAGQRRTLRDMAELCDRLVVMSRTGLGILEKTYEIHAEKLAYIPHGIPDLPPVEPAEAQKLLGLDGRKVLLTFGLLSPGKGIELVLNALPAIVDRHPDALYCIVGATHPQIVRREGHAYRDALEQLVDQLGVRDHVLFHNRFVTRPELHRFLAAADVYVTPYPGREQITSGTLSYAMGAGRPVVSTPYRYAQEMLDQERGLLFDFGKAADLARQVSHLFDNPQLRRDIGRRAYDFTRPMCWDQVAREHLDLLRGIVTHRAAGRIRTPVPRRPEREPAHLPEVSLTHLKRLSDDTGILQHAIYAAPDRRHGYCLDDNARALIAVLMHHDLVGDASVLPLADRYLSFVHHALNEKTGQFRNFMSYDRQWLEETGSQDVQGRAIWALGVATHLAPHQAGLHLAARLLHQALDAAENLTSPRAIAFALVGLHAYLRRFGGDSRVRRARETLAARLFAGFQAVTDDNWPWSEQTLTYDNAKLPHALILSGQWLPSTPMVEQGLRALRWLLDRQINPDGSVSLIGNHGWLARDGSRARFDQQPVEVMALIEACAEAFRCTQDESWLLDARRCLRWFLGRNDAHAELYDYQTGGCRDGLHADGPNLNQGAESTLAWLISLLTLHQLARDEQPAATDEAPPKESQVAGTLTAS
ncbi:MAG: glycosyltransferase family 4 protein, partial [Phycisphaeraceae bacterium]|nr:glycosyltransferase family 4 protein [Phycisphaeraceae bacterium]